MTALSKRRTTAERRDASKTIDQPIQELLRGPMLGRNPECAIAEAAASASAPDAAPARSAASLAPKVADRVATVSARNLLECPSLPVHHLVLDLLLQGVIILGGRPKSRKSFLALALAIAVATGREFLGKYRIAGGGKVLFYALEDSNRRMQARVKAVYDGPPAAVEGLEFCYEPPTLEALEEHLKGDRGIRLVVIDTFALWRMHLAHGPVRVNYGEEYAFLARLRKIVEPLDVTLLLVHHVRKGPVNFDALYGTNGIVGGADQIMLLQNTDVIRGSVLSSTSRDLEDWEVGIHFGDGGDFRLIDEIAELNRLGTMSEARQKLNAALDESGGKGLMPKEAAEKTGLPPDVVRQQLVRMTEAGEASRPARARYYHPKHAPEKLVEG